MKRTMILGLLLTIVLTLGHLPTTTVQAQLDSDAPYIYYYSDILNAFVIERADGTDSRVIGEGHTPEFSNTILGPGWSPSGDWFAWIGTYRFWSSDSGRVPFVVNANGERLNHFEDYLSADIQWSPVDDVLLVVGIKGPIEPQDPSIEIPAMLTIEMIDVATDTILANFETPHMVTFERLSEFIVAFEYPAAPHIRWAVDGQRAVVQYLPEWVLTEQPVSVNRVIVSRDGEIQELTQTDDLDHILLNTHGIHAGKTVSHLENDPATLVIEDILTSEWYEIGIEDGIITQIVLNPTQNAAILRVKSLECDSACPTEYLLWQANSEILSLLSADSPYETPEWSSDGEYAVLNSPQEFPYLLTMNPFTIVQLDDIPPTSHFVWLGDNRVRFVVGRYSGHPRAIEVDLSTRTSVHTIPEDISRSGIAYMGAQWSPDGNDLAFIDVGLLILDENYELITSFRPDGRSWDSFEGVQAKVVRQPVARNGMRR